MKIVDKLLRRRTDNTKPSLTPIQSTLKHPPVNWKYSSQDLATAIAAQAGWQQDKSLAVYDRDDNYIGESLASLSDKMTGLGWVNPFIEGASQINWSVIPDDDEEKAAALR